MLDFLLTLDSEPDDPASCRASLHASLRAWPGDGPPLAEGRADPLDAAEMTRRCMEALQRPEARGPSPKAAPAQLAEVGRALAGALLPPRVREALLARVEAGADAAEPVRLRLCIRDSGLAALPWEYICLDADAPAAPGFLALHPRFQVLRHPTADCAVPARPASPPIEADPLRLLVVWADPRTPRYPALAHLRAEVDSLLALRAAPDCRRIEVRELGCATPANMRRALHEHRPHILHFVGHGDRRLSEGVLVLEAGQPGLEGRVTGEELREWLDGLETRLVVLAACWSGGGSGGGTSGGVAGALAAAGVPAVVAMQLPISDAAAGPFARAFYGALAQPCTVEEALHAARALLRSGPEWGVPVLYAAGPNTDLFRLPAATTPTNLPYARNPHFAGRDRLLAALDAACDAALDEPGLRPVALVAMGGAGKTETAVEYAHTRRARYPGGVFWLNARDATILTEEYAALGHHFGVPEGLSLSERAARVRDRLQRQTRPTLLVFDNVADARTREMLPTVGACRVLVTAREERLVRNRCRVLYVPLLDEDAAVAILASHRAVESPAEGDAARAIAAMVGNLPIALALAAHHVDRLGLTFAEYQTKLAENRLRVLEMARRDFIASTEHTGNIFDAIDIARRSLDETAASVLDTAALFAGGAFGAELMTRARGDLPADEVLEALATLRDRSLLTREQQGRYALHELVRVVAQGQMSDETQDRLQREAMCGLAALLSACNHPMELRRVRPEVAHCRAVLDRAQAVAALAGRLDVESRRCRADLLCELGVYHFEQGELARAEQRLVECLAALEELREDESWRASYAANRAFALRKLGEVRRHLGRHLGRNATALANVREALRMARALYAPEAPELADYYNSVGYVLRWQGKPGRALPYYRRALAISEAARGRSHPDVAMCLNNIAAAHQARGDAGTAQAHFEEALRINLAHDGPDHVNVAIRRNNLGRLLTAQGRPAEALEHHEAALAIYSAAHGRNHPDVGCTMLLAADALHGLGTPEAAARARDYCLEADEVLARFHDPDHPTRVWARTRLASLAPLASPTPVSPSHCGPP